MFTVLLLGKMFPIEDFRKGGMTMHVRSIMMGILVVSITLAGCNTNLEAADDDPNATTNETNEAANDKQPNEAAGTSSESNVEQSHNDDNSAANESNRNNDDNSSKQRSIPDELEKHTFNTSEEAANYMEGYRNIKQTNIDLGFGIEGSRDAGAGHQYISWNEGRWFIGLDYPTDTQYVTEKYPNNTALAKQMVSYLESHYLPAPQDKGVIKVRGFKDSPQVKIQWQVDKVVYEINSDKNNPIEAIQKAIDAGKSL